MGKQDKQVDGDLWQIGNRSMTLLTRSGVIRLQRSCNLDGWLDAKRNAEAVHGLVFGAISG
jgi:hypothetical protein